MKTSELRKRSAGELTSLLAEKRSVLRSLRFNVSSAKAKNVMSRKEARRDIARLLTLLKETK